jgi:cobalt/nickel transport system permease protein
MAGRSGKSAVPSRPTRLLLVGFVVTLSLAGLVSFYASSSPDGLEKVAEDKGFAATAKEHPLAESPLSDYGVKGIDNARVSGGLAGVIGVVATLALGTGLCWAVRRRGSALATDNQPRSSSG